MPNWNKVPNLNLKKQPDKTKVQTQYALWCPYTLGPSTLPST